MTVHATCDAHMPCLIPLIFGTREPLPQQPTTLHGAARAICPNGRRLYAHAAKHILYVALDSAFESRLLVEIKYITV